MKYGSIYIIRNTVNQKVYIGQTTMTVHERFLAHLKPSTSKLKRNYKLYNAMNKYGCDKFYVETLEELVPIEDLDRKEQEYIFMYDSFNKGYNATPGGDGRVLNKIECEDEVLRLAKNGMKPDELALMFNVHKATVLRTLHKLGFRYRPDQTKIVKLASAGMSNKDIAMIIGCNTETVSRALKRANARKHRIPTKLRDSFDTEEIKNDYENQMAITEICKKYNISSTTFYRIKSKCHFKSRPQIYKYKIRTRT